jgi:signal recognition particle subunit SRP54
MFDTLSDRLEGVFKRLRGQGRVSERNIEDALREVRLALLEADVNIRVVRDFIEHVKHKALGQEVLASLTPEQHFILFVAVELREMMGGSACELDLKVKPPVKIMLVGLQGSGKTTSAAKLARLLKDERKRHPLLVSTDVRRPAAMEQLRVLGAQIGVPVLETRESEDPIEIGSRALARAETAGYDAIIFDTAGRLQIDEDLMDELERLRAAVHPHHILLVADAMTGQDAVNVAQGFHDRLKISGLILTKLDSDARGGAALSVRAVTGAPILFAGTGEKLAALEVFHPDRLASRILGMGDVLSLVEKAQAAVDQTKAEELARKLREDSFSLEDFREQLKQLRQMGPLDQILGMLPFGKMLKGAPKDLDGESADLGRFDAIIGSMTPGERRNPEVINGSRRQRIARGSGTSVQDVNRLLKQFAQLRKVMKQFKGMEGKLPRLKNLPGFPTPRG